MNHTDDQPLGEAPIIEMSMAELADRIDVQADRSVRCRVNHFCLRCWVPMNYVGLCADCGEREDS